MLSRRRVRIFGITPVGLGSLALGVVVLWGCLADELITTRRAQAELRASLRQIERLRRNPEPVSQPSRDRVPERPSTV